jgi:hypothetical protein
MRDLDKLPLRELQLLSARVTGSMEATNNTLRKFNEQAHHDSQKWYRTVIQWYIDEYGGWPDETGPGKEVKLLYNV